MRYLREIKEYQAICDDSERKCPKEFKICCRICQHKADISVCSGDNDRGCGEWEVGCCTHEFFVNKTELCEKGDTGAFPESELSDD